MQVLVQELAEELELAGQEAEQELEAGRPRAGEQVAEVGQRQTRRLSRSLVGTGSQLVVTRTRPETSSRTRSRRVG